MDDGFAPVSHVIVFLDYRRSVARLDDSAVVMLAGSDARTHRANMYSNVIGEGRCSDDGRDGCSEKVLSHSLLQIC